MADRAQTAAALALVVMLLGACSPASSPIPATGQTSAATAGPSSIAQATPPATDRLRLIIDTDMAPDDVVAIASLLRDPSVDVLAITVTGTGEAHCPGGLLVARSVVTMLLDTSVPVACGRTAPMGDAQPFPDDWRAGADTGNGLTLVQPAFLPDSRSSEQLLVELAAEEAAAGRRLTILTLGPLTNLAAALELDAGLSDRVRIVAMLGAVAVPGNVTPEVAGSGEPTAEWNAHADPTAVRLVLAAGFDITLVGLDATNSVPLTPDLFHRLEADHAAGPADLVYEIWARNPFMVGGGYYIWDPLTAAVVRDPTLVTTRQATLRVVEGDGLDGGRLLEDPSGAAVTVATSADQARFETLFLASLRIGNARANAFAPVGVIRVTTGPDICEVVLEPSTPPPGLLQVQLTSSGEGSATAILFDPAEIPWPDLVAFAQAPDFEHPPAVKQLAGASLQGAGSATAWGTAASGQVGVACLWGSFETPTVAMRGPFEVRQ